LFPFNFHVVSRTLACDRGFSVYQQLNRALKQDFSGDCWAGCEVTD
jgi:hypothetical protein